MAAEARNVIWRPQPGPQAALIDCPIDEIFYGGARGGGKTDGMIGKNAIKAERYGEHQKGIFFRRELPQLEAAITRTKQVYLPLGWRWAEQKKTFVHPNGATLKFRPLERDQHAEKYQGHDYTDVYFEELTNYPLPDPVNKLRGTLRSAYGIPCQFHGTGNPGGPGHQWVKQRYIDPNPAGYTIVEEPYTNPYTGETIVTRRVFIPARLNDNPALLDSDPGYVARLYQVGSAQLVKAWLEGDWNIVEGAFFDCWTSRNVIQPFEVPKEWTKFRSFDWGFARPFSVGWWTIVEDDFRHGNEQIRRGALIRYREWYGCREPNVGIRLPADKIAEGIKERENEEISYGVADPAIFAEDGGPSHAERMARNGVYWNKADNRRVARVGAIGGWDQMRDRIIGTRSIDEHGIIQDDGEPMIYCFSTCTDSIRTIPALQHDSSRPEDVDTESEDHAADEWRYACMSRPWVKPRPSEIKVDTDPWGRPRHESNWKTG